MPFEPARQFIEDYSKTRADDMSQGKRISWSTAAPPSALTTYSVSELIAIFNRDAEHAEWQELRNEAHPDIAKLIGVNNRIAWLCSCTRDLRMQFAVRGDDVQRTSVDHTRLSLPQWRWVEKGLLRLKALNAERDKGLRNEAAS